MRGLPRRADVAARRSTPAIPGSAQQAEHYSEHIEDRKDDRNVHDLGFLFWPTWRRWYEADRRPDAATTSSSRRAHAGLRFNEKGRYLRSFVAAGQPVHRHHDERRRHLPRRAADRRPRPARGSPSSTAGPPGARSCAATAAPPTRASSTSRPASSCARRPIRAGATTPPGPAGRPGRIYGFGTAYRYTGDRRFLDTADRLRRLLPRAHRRPARPAERLGGPDPVPPVRELGRRDRRRRALAAGRAGPDRRQGPRATPTTRCRSSPTRSGRLPRPRRRRTGKACSSTASTTRPRTSASTSRSCGATTGCSTPSTPSSAPRQRRISGGDAAMAAAPAIDRRPSTTASTGSASSR